MTDEAQAAAYLAGMIDGEGHVRIKHSPRYISIANTDWDILTAVLECCATLGLRHRINRMSPQPGRRPCWQVYITGKESLERVQEIVPIRCRRKQAALGQAIAMFKKTPRPPREWLEQKYVMEGLSLQQVAEAWGKKAAASAHQWMRFYGIPCRSSSEAAENRHKEHEHG